MKGRWFDFLPRLLKYAATLTTHVNDDSIIGQLMTKSAMSSYDRTLHSLEALYAAISTLGGNVGDIYFVGKGGSDSDDGTSWATRRLTIASGYSLCDDGDLLMIGPGTFTEDLTLDTDGVTIVGSGVGYGAGIGGTTINGATIITAGHNVFKNLKFYDSTGTVVTIGPDVQSLYNEFHYCDFSAIGCTVALHINGSGGASGGYTKVIKCTLSGGTGAVILLDTGGGASRARFEDCHIEMEANGNGIHINDGSAIDSLFKNCTINGNASSGTGILVAAGVDNHFVDCAVEDCTTLYDVGGNNFLINCHEESQIAEGTTTEADLKALETLLDSIVTLIGASTDNGDLATLFAKQKQVYLGTHVHVILVVADAFSLDADLDTALKDALEDQGYEVLVVDPADVAGSLELAADFIVVSGSITADTNLANLRDADLPVICHSAEVAVSTSVFSLGATAGTEAAQTDIEIIVNTIGWLIDKATGDLAVTAAATIETMASVSGDTLSIAEEATGTGNDITMARLEQGAADGQGFMPNFDRYFIGIKDFTNANAVFKAMMAELWEHVVHEVRFSEVVVTPKRTYQEQIPDTGFSLASVDTTMGSDPPSADAENSVVDIDKKTNRTFVLRSLFANITGLGTGGTPTMTLQLWIDIGGTPASIDSRAIIATGYYNLMDLFGLQEVHADSIYVTAIVAGGTGSISGVYRYAEAKK